LASDVQAESPEYGRSGARRRNSGQVRVNCLYFTWHQCVQPDWHANGTRCFLTIARADGAGAVTGPPPENRNKLRAFTPEELSKGVRAQWKHHHAIFIQVKGDEYVALEVLDGVPQTKVWRPQTLIWHWAQNKVPTGRRR
jgi:hypothetical protein